MQGEMWLFSYLCRAKGNGNDCMKRILFVCHGNISARSKKRVSYGVAENAQIAILRNNHSPLVTRPSIRTGVAYISTALKNRAVP